MYFEIQINCPIVQLNHIPRDKRTHKTQKTAYDT